MAAKLSSKQDAAAAINDDNEATTFVPPSA